MNSKQLQLLGLPYEDYLFAFDFVGGVDPRFMFSPITKVQLGVGIKTVTNIPILTWWDVATPKGVFAFVLGVHFLKCSKVLSLDDLVFVVLIASQNRL